MVSTGMQFFTFKTLIAFYYGEEFNRKSNAVFQGYNREF